ncbi:MAG: hypothetical protein JSV80_14315, partial [Acidobacteriota bacterium]
SRVLASGGRPALTLDAPDGVRIEASPVWAPALSELAWRIGVERAGRFNLAFSMNGRKYTKHLDVSDEIVSRSPIRPDASFLSQIIFPAEPPLPKDSPIRSIEIAYPDRTVSLFGWHVHWLVAFFILSIGFALLLRNRLGVTI